MTPPSQKNGAPAAILFQPIDDIRRSIFVAGAVRHSPVAGALLGRVRDIGWSYPYGTDKSSHRTDQPAARAAHRPEDGAHRTRPSGRDQWYEYRGNGASAQTDTSGSVSGAGNVQVGAKLRLFADPGGIPVLSILPTINLPIASASKGLGSGDADFTVVVLTGTDLGRRSHVDVNYGIGAIGAGHARPRFTQHLVSVSLSHSVTEQLSPYVEGYWFSKQDPDGGHVFSVDAGLIHAFTARFALDGGVSFGLTSAAPTASVFAGISVIVGDILGDHGVIARQRKAARLHEGRP